MRRTLKDRDSPLYQDTHRGRGGIGGGLYTNGPSDTLASTEYDYLTTDSGEIIYADVDSRIYV